MSILHSYINDLTVQNEELVKVTVELEQDANSRVSLLESKLQKTASALKVFPLYSFFLINLLYNDFDLCFGL